ncbi:hypothetical protein MY4038_003929 [Beauveria bassiana]
MIRFNNSPLRVDYMGDFGDDDHRPAKRIRFDEAGAGQGAPPPDVHEDEIWGMSQASNPEWHFSNSILAPDSFPMSMPGSLDGITPEQIVTIPMSSPSASGFPIDTMVPRWGTRFNTGPSAPTLASSLTSVRVPVTYRPRFRNRRRDMSNSQWKSHDHCGLHRSSNFPYIHRVRYNRNLCRLCSFCRGRSYLHRHGHRSPPAAPC